MEIKFKGTNFFIFNNIGRKPADTHKKVLMSMNQKICNFMQMYKTILFKSPLIILNYRMGWTCSWE
jgi:hypothetical protein